jgi:outer membrane receptor protein involved in Fe transport
VGFDPQTTPPSFYFGEKPTPGFTISNLRAYYKWSKNVNLMGGVTNLGNRLYQTQYDSRLNLSQLTPGGIYQPGRSFYALLEIKY